MHCIELMFVLKMLDEEWIYKLKSHDKVKLFREPGIAIAFAFKQFGDFCEKFEL